MLRILERRKSSREEISEVVLFRRLAKSGLGRYAAGEAKDISEGGLKFWTTEMLFVGEHVEICFRRKMANADTRVRAEVVHISEREDDYEVGARFL